MLSLDQVAVLLALGVFAFVLVALRVAPRRESRLVATSPQSPAPVATGADRPSPRASVGAATAADRGPPNRPVNDDPPFRMQMNAHSHAVEFVRWMRDMGLAGRYSAADITSYYEWFTRDQRVFPIPSMKFLEALNKHPGVGKKRDRLKDAQGRVPKLPSGSPMRTMFYTIADDAVHAPAGVSALDVTPRKASSRDRADIVIGRERIAA